MIDQVECFTVVNKQHSDKGVRFVGSRAPFVNRLHQSVCGAGASYPSELSFVELRHNSVVNPFQHQRFEHFGQYIWCAVFTFNPYLEISLINSEISLTNLEISLINLEISLINLEISLIHLEISLIHLEIYIIHLEIYLIHLEISLIHLDISLIHLEISLIRPFRYIISNSFRDISK